MISASYARAVAISPVRPVMIAELGTNEFGDGGAMKSQWIADMFAGQQSAFPHVRAIAYFDFSSASLGYSYALQSSLASYDAWVAGLRTYAPSGVLNFRGFGPPMGSISSWQS